jgi:hypothetical protein
MSERIDRIPGWWEGGRPKVQAWCYLCNAEHTRAACPRAAELSRSSSGGRSTTAASRLREPVLPSGRIGSSAPIPGVSEGNGDE